MRAGYSNMLSYGEIAEIEKNNGEMIRNIIDRTNRNIAQAMLENLPEVMEYDKAYHVTVRLLDGMNVVGKIEEIPIRTTTLIQPTSVNEYIPRGKLKLKERIRILFKGEL